MLEELMRGKVGRTAMIPPKSPPKPEYTSTSVYIRSSVLRELEEIVHGEGVRSRNKLMGSFLSFGSRLFKKLKGLDSRIEAYENAHVPLTGIDEDAQQMRRAEAIAQLVEKGLDCLDEDCGQPKKPKK